MGPWGWGTMSGISQGEVGFRRRLPADSHILEVVPLPPGRTAWEGAGGPGAALRARTRGCSAQVSPELQAWALRPGSTQH